MDALDRSEIPDVSLREERTTLHPTGKEIVVRGVLLTVKLAQIQIRAELVKPRDGEDERGATVRAGAELAAHAMSTQIFLDDGTPVYTADQWLAYGGKYPNEFLRLQAIADRLADGGDAEEHRKN